MAPMPRSRNWWTLVRQPLLLAFLMGCVVSIAASGGVSARLVVDGALSFAFVPIFELLAFAVVSRRADHAMPFAVAVDSFFLTNAPWLLILTALAAIAAVQTPQQTMMWTVQPWLWIVVVTALAAAVWSAYLDVRFFHLVLRRPAAVADALLLRAIAWPLATIYFLGYAIWPMLVQWGRALR